MHKWQLKSKWQRCPQCVSFQILHKLTKPKLITAQTNATKAKRECSHKTREIFNLMYQHSKGTFSETASPFWHFSQTTYLLFTKTNSDFLVSAHLTLQHFFQALVTNNVCSLIWISFPNCRYFLTRRMSSQKIFFSTLSAPQFFQQILVSSRAVTVSVSADKCRWTPAKRNPLCRNYPIGWHPGHPPEGICTQIGILFLAVPSKQCVRFWSFTFGNALKRCEHPCVQNNGSTHVCSNCCKASSYPTCSQLMRHACIYTGGKLARESVG